MGYFRRGRHRGEYVEKPEWLTPREPWYGRGFTFRPDGSIVWRGRVTLAEPATGREVAVIVPRDSVSNLPALVEDGHGQETRRIVREELAATPIWADLRCGGWGDLDFDRVDNGVLCGVVAAEPIGG